jgi:hypothetical protein
MLLRSSGENINEPRFHHDRHAYDSPDSLSVMTSGIRRMLGMGLDTWNTLTVVFLGLAAVAAVALGIAQWTVIKLQKEEARIASTALEKYKEATSLKIAEADAAAKNAGERTEDLRHANLALEAQIAPRRLNSVPIGEVIEPLVPFAGKKVRLASYALDTEGAVLALRIKEALVAAKLEVDTEQASGVLPFGKIAFGVFVDGPDQELAKALAAALAPVKAVAAPVPHKIPDTDAAATVFVAAKPPIQ